LHDLFQARPFPPEFLGTLLVAPDVRLFEFPSDFGQAFAFGIKVKDTP
jgi:hypothetical protein